MPPGSFLSGVPLRDQDELLKLGSGRRFGRGTNLMVQGEAGNESFILLKGFVKILGDSRDGNSTLLAIRMAGDIVGEIALKDGGPRSATVQAATQTWARVIPARQFLAFLAGHPATDQVVQTAITAKLRQAIRHRVDLNGAPVLRRLARVIQTLARSYGQDTPEGLLIGAPLSQADLAALVGATEQSTRRALGALRDDGLITSRYLKLYVTDVFALQEVAEGRRTPGTAVRGALGATAGHPGRRP